MQTSVELEDCPVCRSSLTLGPVTRAESGQTEDAGGEEAGQRDDPGREEADQRDDPGREDPGPVPVQPVLLVAELECSWPLLHKHLREWNEKKTFRSVMMANLDSDQQRPGLRSGTQEIRELQQLGEAGIIESVTTRCTDVCGYLHEGLDEVYNEEDLEMIGHIRTVLDLQKILELVRDMGAAAAAQRMTRKFMTAAEHIDPNYEDRCAEDEMRAQHQAFLRSLADVVKMKNSETLTSMQIMVLMMNTDGKRYLGCEAVMDILCKAAAMKSVESIVESWISVLEHHSNKSRNLKAETIETEMHVAINGPLLQHCDQIVEESMTAYWRKMKKPSLQKGHFTRRGNRVREFLVSRAVDTLNKKPVETPFLT
jgi:hypothetical protein